MFLPPLILLPFVLALSAYRLYRIPMLLWSGGLQLNEGRFYSRTLLTALAYIGLLAYTAVLAVIVALAIVRTDTSSSSLLPIASAIAGYPVAYIGAEWVFYYGFRRQKRGAA